MSLFNYTGKPDQYGHGRPLVGKIIGHSILALFLIITFFSSFGTIAAGNVGVKTRFSKVVGTVQPGLYLQVPYVENVTSMDVQTQKDQADATAASNDLQDVTATVAVNYHVEPQDAATIFANIGQNYADRVIAPAIAESVKAIAAKYTAEQLITERETVRQEIIALLSTKLQVYGVHTDSLNIVNFAFSDQFNKAIEAKVTTQQNALAAENKLKQVQFEAEQRVAQAKGEADAIVIQQQALNAQGGAAYLQLQAITKWDGHYPQTMLGGNSVPLISVSGK